LPAFRATVTEGKAESVMCAYNRVNDQPACASTFLLKDQLRGAWKFNGYVVSDCDAIVDVFTGHHFTKSFAEAAALSMKTGMDNECADFFTKATDNSDYVKYIDVFHQRRPAWPEGRIFRRRRLGRDAHGHPRGQRD